MRKQVKEQEALRMKGKLALGGAGSGSGRFNAKFMRTLSLQASGSSGATWQVQLDIHLALCSPAFSVTKLPASCNAWSFFRISFWNLYCCQEVLFP